MFKTRLISSIVLVAILAVCLLLGGNVLFFLLLAISLIAYFELTRATKVLNKDCKNNTLEVVGAFGVIFYYVVRYLANTETYIMLTFTVTLVALLVVYVVTFPKYHANQVMAVFFSFFYGSIMLSYIYLTRNLNDGLYLVWLIFISSWVCDTCAYAVGVLIGKHKLAPVLSPKKSIEGCIGGIAGAVLVGFLYSLILKYYNFIELENMWSFPVIAGVGAVISQIGDLAASAIKRNFDIKDYGKLIPGHGGIMDRFDSVIFTAPMIYYLAVLILNKTLY